MGQIQLTKTMAAKFLGAVSTPKKAEAARRNGLLGGRPHKLVEGEKLYERVFHYSRAKPFDKLVLVVIATHWEIDRSSPTVPTIAREANLSVRAVYRALKELERIGELGIHRSPGMPSEYVVRVGIKRPEKSEAKNRPENRPGVDE